VHKEDARGRPRRLLRTQTLNIVENYRYASGTSDPKWGFSKYDFFILRAGYGLDY